MILVTTVQPIFFIVSHGDKHQKTKLFFFFPISLITYKLMPLLPLAFRYQKSRAEETSCWCSVAGFQFNSDSKYQYLGHNCYLFGIHFVRYSKNIPLLHHQFSCIVITNKKIVEISNDTFGFKSIVIKFLNSTPTSTVEYC